MPTRMLVSPLSAAAENEQARHRAAEDEEGRIDSGAEEKREYDDGDDHADPAREGALGQADGSGGKEPDGDGSQPALNRASPAPPFEPEPEAARPEGEQARRTEERDDHDDGADHSRHLLADRRHHHHVRPGGHLAEAVEMDELLEGEPVIRLDGERLELRESGQPTANRQKRQIGEYPDEGGELAHRLESAGASVRGRCHQIASAPSPASTTSTEIWNTFTPTTARATKTRSSIRVRTLRPIWTETAATRPTAAAATPWSMATTRGRFPCALWSMPITNMMRPPGRQTPAIAAVAPSVPRRRSPASTAMFVEFRPGRLWLMASIWTKVGSSIQPCLSTRLLRR